MAMGATFVGSPRHPGNSILNPRPHDNPARLEQTGLPFLLLVFSIPVATFWQCVELPFIQDDWVFLHYVQTHDIASLLRSFVDVGGALMYRPAGFTYLTLLMRTFGDTAWPCHVMALGIHILNTLMVARVIGRLTGDRSIAWLGSLMYAAAVAIHLDSLCWAVGIHDLGGAFFFFTSMALFQSDRTALSAFCFLGATLFKESTVVLPAVLAAIGLMGLERWSLKGFLSVFRRLLAHFVILALILGIKVLMGESPFGLPSSHPYVMIPFGMHLFSNAYRYCFWMLQTFMPFGRLDSGVFRFVLPALFVLAAIVISRKRFNRKKLLAGLALWMLFSFLPVLFMPNHCFRYYAIYALPAFICAVLLIFQNLLTQLGLRRRRDLVLACVGAFSILLSIVQSNRLFSEGLDAKKLSISEGTNHLIQRAAEVNLVRTQLLGHLPSPATDTNILFGGVDLWAFGLDFGPMVWYRNTRVSIYDLKDLRYDARGFFVENKAPHRLAAAAGADIQRIDFDPSRLYAFRLSDELLIPIAPETLVKIAASQSGAHRAK